MNEGVKIVKTNKGVIIEKNQFFSVGDIQVDTSKYTHSKNEWLLWGLQIHCQNSIFRKRILTVRIDWPYLGNIFEFPF